MPTLDEIPLKLLNYHSTSSFVTTVEFPRLVGTSFPPSSSPSSPPVRRPAQLVMKKSLLPVRNVSASKKHSVGKEDLVRLLKQYFGYPEFRGKQLEAIEAVLAGRDCFCLMPTGGGKSMCFQIPALAKPGIVLVISPLIALMENQVAALKMKGISAEFLSSTQTAQTKEKFCAQIQGVSSAFSQCTATHGIDHQFSCQYSSQQNGVAERKHRHNSEKQLLDQE